MRTRNAPLVLILVLAARAEAQRSQASAPPLRPAHAAIVAPRYLAELQPEVGFNSGVRAVGDLDRDGDQDFLMLAGPFTGDVPRTLESWMNDGRGHFTRAHTLALTNGQQDFNSRLANELELADLDGDGVLDVAYERFSANGTLGPSGVLVHFGFGDGSFGPPVLLTRNGAIIDFTLGDADADGDLDVAIEHANTETDYQRTLVWWHLDGRSFLPGPEFLLAQRALYEMQALDVDGDGADEVVACSFDGYNELRVFRSTGAGFVERPELALPPELANINQYLRKGDLDGDGDTDLLLTLPVFGVENFAYLLPFLTVGTGLVRGELQTLQGDIYSSLSYEGELADWDADGDLDFVNGHFRWLENVGGARFVSAARVDAFSAGSTAHVADLDGDRHLDVLCGWTLMTGDGDFPTRTSLAPRSTVFAPAGGRWEDDDRDGDLDSHFTESRYENAGNGTFTRVLTPFPRLDQDLRVRAEGDFDGDGFGDVLVAAFDGQYPFFTFDRMKLLSGRQDGPYVLSPVLPAPVEMVPTAALVGDLDVDGDQDILDLGGFWANDGTGVFGSATVPAYTGLPLLAQDFDADQRLDLVVKRAGRIVLLRNQGALSFASFDLGAWVDGARPQFLDVDEDGDLDIVIPTPPSTLAVIERRPGGLAAPRLLECPGVGAVVGQLDVDGDGRLDLAVGGNGPGLLLPHALLCAWPRGLGADFGTRLDWIAHASVQAFGDFDGDGDTDVMTGYPFANFARDPGEAGAAEQYSFDASAPGTGGIRPVLGARGPFAPRDPAVLALGRGLGGTTGWLVIGPEREHQLVNGLLSVVASSRLFRSFTLSGAPGVPGAGSLELPLHVPATWFARTFRFQAFLDDPAAPTGITSTNGVEVRFGTGAVIER